MESTAAGQWIAPAWLKRPKAVTFPRSIADSLNPDSVPVSNRFRAYHQPEISKAMKKTRSARALGPHAQKTFSSVKVFVGLFRP